MKNKNVTLVYPAVRYAGFNCLGKTLESCFVNHGLPSLAAVLQQQGYSVRCLDLREMRGWGDVENFVRCDPAQKYGVTMATLDYYDAVKVAELIKRLKPNSHVTVGGPHPSVCPDDVAKQQCFNNVLVGEGEDSYPTLLANPDRYGKIVSGQHPNLDSLPYENREIFNMQKIQAAKSPFNGKPFFPMPFINVISGRGCVFQCGFCKPGEDRIFGKFRMRSLEHFFGEVKQLHDKYHYQTLMIDDDSFTLWPNYTQAFCELYAKQIRKPFYCQSRVDFIVRNPDLVKYMRDCGLTMFFIGFESGSQRMLDFMQKGTTVEQNLEAAEICHRLGVKIWCNFMVGLPTETKEEIQATFSMVKQIKPDKPSGAFFTPIYGTHLYDYCKANDLLISEDPAVLGSRNPGAPKIKGHDYDWMTKQMYPNSGKLWRKIGKKVLSKLR